MSRVPIGSTTDHGPGEAYGPTVHGRFDFIHQGLCAEEIARRWGISREDMDRFALRSHDRAARAIAEGRFDGRSSPWTPGGPGSRTRWPWPAPTRATRPARVRSTFDEGVRAGSTYEKLASLPPRFVEDGLVTAASSSQISDGAAAVLIMSRGAGRRSSACARGPGSTPSPWRPTTR